VFQVIHGKFRADIVVPTQGQNDTMLFTSAGHNGTFGDGAVQLIAGGEPLDSGMVAVGEKGGRRPAQRSVAAFYRIYRDKILVLRENMGAY